MEKKTIGGFIAALRKASAASLSSTINTLFCVIYPIEFLIALLIYFKKRAK